MIDLAFGTASQARQGRLLFLLYDIPQGHPQTATEVLGNEYDPDDQVLWRDALRNLANSELIYLYESLSASPSDASVHISEQGRAVVEGWKGSGRTGRNRAVWDAIMRYVHEHERVRFLSAMPPMTYHWAPITDDDLGRGLGFLARKGLVEAISLDQVKWLNVTLTEDGYECVEEYGGSVNDYLKSKSGMVGNTNINVNGNGNNVASQSHSVAQSSTVSGSTLSLADLSTLLRDIRAAAPELDLDSRAQDWLSSDLASVEGEASRDEPDPGIIKTLLRRVIRTVGSAAASAVATDLIARAEKFVHQIVVAQ